MLKNLLITILRILAKLTLWRYRPKVIGVTGSVGKTSAKEAIFTVLKSKFRVRRNYKNYNNEIGVPLTIIGAESGGRSLSHWLKAFLKGTLGLIYTPDYPEILVLEMGADKIGDIAYLVSFVKCDVGVVTAISEIPAHLEFFWTPGQVVQEKGILIESLSASGRAILNFDDERVRGMIGRGRAKVLGFGFSQEAELRASDLKINAEDLSQAYINFKVNYSGSSVPVRLEGILGGHQVYPVLAAVGAGLFFGMNLVDISQALRDYRPPRGRMNILAGLKHSWIIDDTYNASPAATLSALEALTAIEAPRKIAVLGDMLELGSLSEEAHRQVGERAAQAVDILLTVGQLSVFTADEARQVGLAKDRILRFLSSEEAGKSLQGLLREGDVVLVKGSQGMRMEKIVKEVMAEPQRAEELLVRQEPEWQKK